MYRAGIIGLPNVGKSTLFNALVKNYQAEASNYPFCTIEPNVGIVNLNDTRLEKIAKIINTKKIIPAAFEFIDIAGLVKGASHGEGLGNQFLGHIREVDAIVHVVRCFEEPNIAHIEPDIDPLRDIKIVEIELALSDLQRVEKQIEDYSKRAKSNDKTVKRELLILKEIQQILNDNKPLQSIKFEKEDLNFYNLLFLLSNKPVIYACNVLESDLKRIAENKFLKSIQDYASSIGAKHVPICAKLEEDLISLSTEERETFLDQSMQLSSGVENLIKETFDLLGLTTFFTTTGDKEVRAWTILKSTKALHAAGVIHSDFEKGFIKAEVIKYSDLLRVGSKLKVREAGLAHFEGKDYLVQDGDIVEFKFNV